MLFTYIILAFSLSIDSIGIGVTYGIRRTRLLKSSILVLFIISLLFTSISLLFGNLLMLILPHNIANIIGSLILIIMGLWIIFEIFSKKKNVLQNVDNNKDNIIDIKEAALLGTCLSIDSISASFGSGISGITSLVFPLITSLFHICFLLLGVYLGKKIGEKFNFPENLCNIISGVILVIIGIISAF